MINLVYGACYSIVCFFQDKRTVERHGAEIVTSFRTEVFYHACRTRYVARFDFLATDSTYKRHTHFDFKLTEKQF